MQKEKKPLAIDTQGLMWGVSNDAGMTVCMVESKSKSREELGFKYISFQQKTEVEDGSRKAEERDRESEEEVCDFGVGVGAWGWGGCQLVLFPVDKTLRSLSLCRSLSLSYSAILSPLPPLLWLSLCPPPLLLCYFPPRCALEKGKDLTSSKVKRSKNSCGRSFQFL